MPPHFDPAISGHFRAVCKTLKRCGMGLNLPLTRRRDPDYEAWLMFYGDLHIARSACDLALRLLVQFQPNLIAVSCTALSIRSVAIRFLLTPCQSRMRLGYERPLLRQGRSFHNRSICEWPLCAPQDNIPSRLACDPGCVKTRASRECAELFSPFSSFDCDCQCCSFPIQRNRDKSSTRKFDVGVFTQAGPEVDEVA